MTKANRLSVFKNIFFCSCVFFYFVFNTFRLLNPKYEIIGKSLASLSFVLTGFCAFFSNKDKSSAFVKMGRIMLTALILSFIADVIIEYSFIWGMVAFLVAVLVYFYSCFSFGKPDKKFLLIIVLIYTPYAFIINLIPGIEFGAMRIPAAVYSMGILLFTVKAFGGFSIKSKYTKQLAIGSLLFIVSDFDLLIASFAVLSPTVKTILLVLNGALYFPGQALIANSLSEDFLQKK